MIRTSVSTVTSLKELMIEAFMNHTSKVTKISDGSVLNGAAFGIAKTAQKALKDVSLLEARLFPSTAFGTYLDDVALEQGIAARFGASVSSTYILIVGDVGTVYTAGVNFFSGNTNVSFELVDNVTIPDQGYTYALVRSTTTGAEANVDPLVIDSVSPQPAGHDYVINEFVAIGGADAESDDIFRMRIRDTSNIVSMDTLGRLTQVFIKINSKVLRLFYYGINAAGQTIIAVVTQDGAPLSGGEIDDLLVKSSTYLCVSDLKPFGSTQYSIAIQNISWYELDVDFRVSLLPSYNADSVRKSIQVAISKYLDYRTWSPISRIEWDDLLQIVKSTEGVKYVPDTYFLPRVDITIAPTQLPRVRGFIMRDLDNLPISDGSGALNPTFFPNKPINAYQATVLITA
mgnify:CR=1 FL=1